MGQVETKQILSPLQAIRKYCLWCSNNQAKEIRLCLSKECPLWELRMGKRVEGAASTLRAIRAKCLDCSSFSSNKVTACEYSDCPLFVFRSGHNPRRKGIGGKPPIKHQFGAVRNGAHKAI